ncbi:MAG: DinB family protein [Anaerolineae bacterium]|nr:DinB family protein [Anaerolineae bacterium]
MRLSDVQLLFDYNYWTNELIVAKAAQLSPQQLSQPADFPWGSLRGTLIHLLDAEYFWRNLCQHGRLNEHDLSETEPFPTLDSIVAYWKNEEREMRAYLASLRDEDMETIVRYEIPEGRRERLLWHCLVHVVNHGTQHRSEAASMLTGFGHSPGDIDMTLFLNWRAGIK